MNRCCRGVRVQACCLGLLTIAVLAGVAAQAQGTRLWTQSRYEEFEKGTPKGAAISSEGFVAAGPALKQLAVTGSTYVWSVAAANGEVYAGTGSPARVVRVSADGRQTMLFESKELAVQVVRVAPDGTVYAATLPGGRVYRLKAGQINVDESKAEAVFDPATAESKAEEQPKYIWDMAFDAKGQLYIATGAPAAIYRIGGPKPEKFFTSDEQHIRCLLFEKNGSLLAGTDSGGLVYRVSSEGKGVVIYDSPKAEITSLAEAEDGTLYVAAVGEKNKNGLPPLPVQGNTSVTTNITIVQPGSIQAGTANGLIPDGSDVYAIDAGGAPRKLWTAREDVIYALQATPAGLLAATGNRGHVYRVQPDGSFEDIAHAEASQVTAFAATAHGMVLGTSNAGKVFTLTSDARTESSYESAVYDASFFSQFGQPEMETTGGSRFELSVRTGNVSSPARGWGEWQRVTAGSAAKITPGRYVQWKVVLHQGSGHVNSVGIHYLPVNVAPVVDEVVVTPGARVNPQALQVPVPQQVQITFPNAQPNPFLNLAMDGPAGPLAGFKDRTAVTARWLAHDDNGDELSFRIYFKGEGEQNWLLLRDRTRERYVSFEAAHLPDGIYRLKIVASDLLSHNEGEARTGEHVSDRFVIDTTPPSISNMAATAAGTKLHIAFNAEDAMSTIDRAEYSIDAGRWQYVEPAGRLSDSKEERYDFTAPAHDALPVDGEDGAEATPASPGASSKEHVVTVRVYDHYGNVTAAKAVVH